MTSVSDSLSWLKGEPPETSWHPSSEQKETEMFVTCNYFVHAMAIDTRRYFHCDSADQSALRPGTYRSSIEQKKRSHFLLNGNMLVSSWRILTYFKHLRRGNACQCICQESTTESATKSHIALNWTLPRHPTASHHIILHHINSHYLSHHLT